MPTITIECSDDAAPVIVAALTKAKQLSNLGGSKDILFFFDGDGYQKVKSIKVGKIDAETWTKSLGLNLDIAKILP